MERTLHVMRHAKSDWHTDRPDHQRPLNARGRRDAFAAGEYLASLPHGIDTVLSSSSTRTRETWARVTEAGVMADSVQFLDEIYAATVSSAARLLRNVESTNKAVLWLGHFPTVEDIVATLGVPEQTPAWNLLSEKYPTSAIATLTFDGDWAELGRESCILVDFVIPRG